MEENELSQQVFDENHYLDNNDDNQDADGDNVKQSEDDQAEHDNEGDQSVQQDDSTEEIELDGQVYKIPKELKDSFLRQADYTRKTQELSTLRRQAEATAQEIEIQKEVLPYQTHLKMLNDQIRQYDGLDWGRLTRENPVESQIAWQNYQRIKDDASNIERFVASKQSELTAIKQQQQAEMLSEGHKSLKRDIPNWSPEYGAELARFGVSLGFSHEEMNSVYDPRLVKLLHGAYQISKNVQQAQVKPQQKQVKPVQKLSNGNSPASKDPSKMSADEWMKHRNEQIKNRKK